MPSVDVRNLRSQEPISQAQVSQDGNHVVLAMRGGILILNRRGEVEANVASPPDESEVDRIALSRDATFVAVAHGSGRLRLLERDTRRWVGPVEVGHLRALAVSGSGELVVAAGEEGVMGYKSGLQGIWTRPFPAVCCDVAVARNGLEAVTVSWDGAVVWHDRWGAAVASSRVEGVAERAAMTEDLESVVVTTEDGKLSWVSRDGRAQFTHDLPGRPTGLAIAPDGGLAVVVLAPDRNVDAAAIAYARDGTLLFQRAPRAGQLSGRVQVFSEGGAILFAGSDHQLHLVGRSGAPLWTHDVGSPLVALSGSLNGQLIVTVDQQAQVSLFTPHLEATPTAPGAPPAATVSAPAPTASPPSLRPVGGASSPSGPAPSMAPPTSPPVPAPSGAPGGTPPPPPPPSYGAASSIETPAAMDLSGIDPKKSIAVLGETRSGKTVFFAMMSVAFSDSRWAGTHHLTYRREGFHYISGIRLDLEKGIWPQGTPTTRTVLMGATLTWKDRLYIPHTRHMILTDLSGEDFRELMGYRSTGRREIRRDFQPTVARLTSSGGFVFLVDGTATDHALMEAGLNFYAFILAVLDQNRVAPHKKLQRPVIVVFTKYDEMPSASKVMGARVLARDKLPDLYRLLAEKVPPHLLEFVYCSAVGLAIPGAPGEPSKIRLPLAPSNVAQVIEWVATKMPD
jgi:hypothetical protein